MLEENIPEDFEFVCLAGEIRLNHKDVETIFTSRQGKLWVQGNGLSLLVSSDQWFSVPIEMNRGDDQFDDLLLMAYASCVLK